MHPVDSSSQPAKQGESNNEQTSTDNTESTAPRPAETFGVKLGSLLKKIDQWVTVPYKVIFLTLTLSSLAAVIYRETVASEWSQILTWLVLLISFVIGIILTFYLLVWLLNPGSEEEGLGVIERIELKFDHAYRKNDISLLLYAHIVLRSVTAICCTLGAFSLIQEQHSKLPDDRASWLGDLHWGLLFASVGYLLLGISVHVLCRSRVKSALESANYKYRRGVLWNSALIDYVVLTLLNFLVIPERWPIHLAFIIPTLGAWLFSNPRNTILIIWLVLATLTLDFWLTLGFARDHPEFSSLVGTSSSNLKEAVLAHWLPQCVFWIAIGLTLIMMRKLRSRQEDSSAAFRALAGNIEYSVFVKGKDREFKFLNSAMLTRLRPFLTAQYEKLKKKHPKLPPPDQMSWEDVCLNKLNDNDLDIDCSQYQIGDHQILEGKKEIYQELERNFQKLAGTEELIYTIKTPLRNKYGEITGLIGICLPGAAFYLAQIAEVMFRVMPGCVILKGRNGRIKWANHAFCESIRDKIKVPPDFKATDPLLPQLLTMHDGKSGPDDIEIYGEELGAQYQRGDSLIRESARKAHASNSNPLFGAYPAYKEFHIRPGHGDGRWVEVVKRPWPDERDGVCQGVMIFFHDVHVSYCKESMLGRWNRKHLPRFVFGSARTHRTNPKASIPAHGKIKPTDFKFIALALEIMQMIRSFVEERPYVTSDSTYSSEEATWLEEILRDTFREINVSFETNIPTGCIFAGGVEIEAIITVLVMNAAAYRGGAKFGLKTRRLIQNAEQLADTTIDGVKIRVNRQDNHIRIVVEDDGPGFDADTLRDIPRGCAMSKDPEFGGPGSGFYLLRKLANHFQGNLSVKNVSSNGGGRVIFSAPISGFSSRKDVEDQQGHVAPGQ